MKITIPSKKTQRFFINLAILDYIDNPICSEVTGVTQNLLKNAVQSETGITFCKLKFHAYI